MNQKQFDIHVFPAQRGDALWIEYGCKDHKFRMLIDAGISSTARATLLPAIRALPAGSVFELLIVTHIDVDHIQGVIDVLEGLPTHVSIKEIWFNGPHQLERLHKHSGGGYKALGIPEGNELARLLKSLPEIGWNTCVETRAICSDHSPDAFELQGGMRVTVLSPSLQALETLQQRWADATAAYASAAIDLADTSSSLLPGFTRMGPIDRATVENMAKSLFKEDTSFTNASSIAVKLEFGEASALMLADAFPTQLLKRLDELGSLPLDVDCVKLPHHGSAGNLSPDLAASLHCRAWIFSSNGANNTRHPSEEAVARVLHAPKTPKSLYFNYLTKYNRMWKDADLQAEFSYTPTYGDGFRPLVVRLLPRDPANRRQAQTAPEDD